jgi:hypothetical protein
MFLRPTDLDFLQYQILAASGHLDAVIGEVP